MAENTRHGIPQGMPDNKAIGAFMMNFDASKERPVQFHRFPEMDDLSPSDALDLLQWLYERRDALIALAHDDHAEDEGQNDDADDDGEALWQFRHDRALDRARLADMDNPSIEM